MKQVSEVNDKDFTELWFRFGGNIRAVTRELGLNDGSRERVRERAKKLALYNRPITGGVREERPIKKAPLPGKNLVKRYLLTSAQNNTDANEGFWTQLLALADYYDAEILVGTFSYNQNSFGNLAVKQGTRKTPERKLWFDPLIKDYISDQRLELAPGLMWCGEMNILPTAVKPLSGLETYTHRASAIFPHAKVAMESIATMQGEGTKFNYTTGCVTLRNYIQKKEGIKAEHHHRYAALVVEVNHAGNWWVRQIGYSSKGGKVQDLDVVVDDLAQVTSGNPVEAITWGDLHATHAEPGVIELSMQMLDHLKPRFQFLHDVMEGASTNRHVIKNAPDPHYSFNRWLRGLHRVDEELRQTVAIIQKYLRPGLVTVVPDSNHDGWWLRSWLSKYDARYDPANIELHTELQGWMLAEIRRLAGMGKSHKNVNLTQHVMEKFGLKGVKFLLPDESFTICNRKIEGGMHGHLGPNGARGTHNNLSNIGRRANTAHEHSAGIYNGLYVAGHSTKEDWSYQYGPSSGSHSHILTYPNGMRAIVTMWAGKWRA